MNTFPAHRERIRGVRQIEGGSVGTSLVYTADAPEQDTYWGDFGGAARFLYTVRDADGELHLGAVDVAVYGANDAPVAGDDAFAVSEGMSTGNLFAALLSNDIDLDIGQRRDIVDIDTTGTAGRLSFDPDTDSLVYHADTALLVALGEGQTFVDHFTYTLRDEDGATSTASVSVTVTGSGAEAAAMLLMEERWTLPNEADLVPVDSADWAGFWSSGGGWASSHHLDEASLLHVA